LARVPATEAVDGQRALGTEYGPDMDIGERRWRFAACKLREMLSFLEELWITSM